MKKAVILLSGGMDSATCLAYAKAQGFACYALSVDYGQRHSVELQASALIAQRLGAVEHRVMRMDLAAIGGSALTDATIAVPTVASEAIPITYVPARNTLFLALALGWAEVLQAQHIFIGANAVDYSGYPDCRGAFIEAFERLASVATKAGVEGMPFHIEAPLLHLSKTEIIQWGVKLGVDYSWTISCYQADQDGRACGICDSCRLRREGFEKAGVTDVTRYL